MRLTSCLALLLISLSISAQSATSFDTQSATSSDVVILTQEQAFWTAYVSGDSTALGKLLLPEFTNVEQNIWSRDKVLAFVKQFHEHCSLAPVKIEEPVVAFLTPDIATVHYHAIETPTCGSRSMSGTTNISTVWIRRDGRWQMHLHTEYAVPPQ
jgi:uncharacterized protein (TIGR02246 family)